MATEEEGHIRAEPNADAGQLGHAQTQFPEPVERQQAGRGVRRATPHSGLGGNALVDADVHALLRARGLAQGLGRADAQVDLGQCGADVLAADNAIGTLVKVQHVAPVDQHKGRLQQVVPVGAAPCDVQEQVQLGGSGNIQDGLHERETCARKARPESGFRGR